MKPKRPGAKKSARKPKVTRPTTSVAPANAEAKPNARKRATKKVKPAAAAEEKPAKAIAVRTPRKRAKAIAELPKPGLESLPDLPVAVKPPLEPVVPVVAVPKPVSLVAKTETTPHAEEKPPAEVPQPSEHKTEAKPLPWRIPPILLEGDEPTAAPIPRRGEKFALGPVAGGPGGAAMTSELPEAYGTGRLHLVARDPHCLYANWDLTIEQQRLCNGLSKHRHLVVRVHLERVTGAAVQEIHVHPESRHWFIHVDRAGATYVAELGYYHTDGQWRSVAMSDPVMAPVDQPAEDKEVQFAVFEFKPASTPPPVAPMQESRSLPALVREPAREAASPPPSIPAREWFGVRQEQPVAPTWTPETPRPEEQAEERVELPAPRGPEQARIAAPPSTAPAWTPEQERALAELIGWSIVRQQWFGSAEIAEVLEGRLPGPGAAVSSLNLAGLPEAQAPAGVTSPAQPFEAVTSPAGQVPPGEQKFWFKVNADLVIYGATEPDAKVTIAGRTIRLRPDGTFSYRFALPDGFYPLPITAQAVHGDRRTAELEFYRGTRYRGEVGAHPREPGLKPPHPENVS